MKALWVFHYPVYGGPHNLAVGVSRPMASLGWEFAAVLTDEPGNAKDRLVDAGVETVTMPLHRLRASKDPRDNLRMALAFRDEVRVIERLIADRGADLVVLTGLVNIHGAVAARRADVPIVWQVVDSRIPPLPRAAAMKVVRRCADAVMFNGRAIEALHLGKQQLEAPSFQFTGGVDTARFRPDLARGAATRRRFGVPQDALFVGTVANLNPMKGIEHFIRAAAAIHRERPGSWFMISGSKHETHRKYLAALHEEINGSGVPSERFIWTEDPPDDAYCALDVMLITSRPRSEGTTTTALEALACEVPVVATDVGSVREVVENEVTGLMVPADSPTAIASATLRLATNPDQRKEFGTAGRIYVMEKHSVVRMASVYDRAFRAAIERRLMRSRSVESVGEL
jgi:glycosyltransferase involved in cell wall biosynthesis